MNRNEVKGTLARLLATENLVVEHKKVSTACFDVERRVLTLPIWEKASAIVYDLLVGHEVGHALYTPKDSWEEILSGNIPKDFVNVVEDARIEKLMKRKFPGMAKSFYKGYQELNDNDFFGIADTDISTMSFIDRINMFFKIGAYSQISFNEKEQVFIEMIDKAETFDDVLEICKKLCEYVKNNKKDSIEIQNKSQQSDSGNQSNEMTSQNTSQDSSQSKENNEDKSEVSSDFTEDFTETASQGTSGSSIDEKTNEEVSRTQQSFDEKTESLVDKYARETIYINVPKVDMSKLIVDNASLVNYIEKFYNTIDNDEVDAQYKKFKQESQREVNYLVKEFECKKSADAYQRVMLNKTGTLDTSKLHTYKYNDDIFRKVAVVPDGKNHGMIFILDWSGSMGNHLLPTVKQLMNLCWFCRKVQIPFEVYAFTGEWQDKFFDNSEDFDNQDSNEEEKMLYKIEDNTFHIDYRLRLLNFLSSKVNNKKFEQAMINFWRCACANDSKTYYSCLPLGLDLSGTPLNETIACLNTIIPEFIKKTKVQKTNVVILTDGEAGGSCYRHRLEIPYNKYKQYGHRRIHDGNVALRNKKTGRVYKNFSYDTYETNPTSILLQNLKDNNSDVNIIGFRICCGYEFSRAYKNIANVYECSDVSKQFSKHKSYEVKNCFYDSLFFISSTNLDSENKNFEVNQDATPAQIGKAFRSMLKKKQTNKKMLSSFATLIS